MIEVEVPTGYVAFQIDLERSIHEAQVTRSFPSLRDVIGGHGDTFAKKTVWFFDYVSVGILDLLAEDSFSLVYYMPV